MVGFRIYFKCRELVRFVNGLNVKSERKRRIKDYFKVLILVVGKFVLLVFDVKLLWEE